MKSNTEHFNTLYGMSASPFPAQQTGPGGATPQQGTTDNGTFRTTDSTDSTDIFQHL